MLRTRTEVVEAHRPRAASSVVDFPTLIAVSVVAWALVDVFHEIVHEIVGHGGRRPVALASRQSIPRSNARLAIGLVALALFVAVLGPGIGSFAGHPALR